jgi:peptide/nickel transport system permease protein
MGRGFMLEEAMLRYIIRRLLQAIPTLFGITVISFMLMSAAPGGPTASLFSNPKMKQEQLKILEAQLGLNDPWPVQYLHWLIGDDWRMRDTDGDGTPDTYGQRRGILRGDFGISFSPSRRPVIKIIGEHAAATLELGGLSLFFGLIIGVPLGVIAAVRQGGLFDNVTRIFAVLIRSIPIFWLGLMLILIFGAKIQINHEPFLPMGSRCPPGMGCPPIWARLNYLILPTFVLAAGGVAVFSRFMRASMLDVIHQDYVRTARSKGLENRKVWFGHAARNALIPVATILGPSITGILGGAVVTETIFSWPGLGRKTVEAVFQQDYPMIMATVIIAAVATLLGFILSDVLYALIDPRIRFS